MFRPLLSPAVCLTLPLLAPAAMADGGTAARTGEVIRTLQALAERPAAAVHVDLAAEGDPEQVLPPVLAAPNLRTLVVAGPRFEDRHFERLAAIPTLETLVLDCTEVSEEAVVAARRRRPELTILRSQRWAMARLPVYERRLDKGHPKLRTLLGDRLFERAVDVSFRYRDDVDGLDYGEEPVDGELLPIKHLVSLEKLDVRYSKVDQQAVRSLAHLKRLKWFTGAVGDGGVETLSTLDGIETLFLEPHPSLSDKGLEPLRDLKRLELLALRTPTLTGAGLKHLAGLPALGSLTLRFEVQTVTHLPRIRPLKSLYIYGGTLDAAAMEPLARCERLETLWFENTELADAGLVHLKELSKLRSLSLKRTGVGDAGAVHLLALKNLKVLSIGGTKIGAAMRGRLKKALPDCDIWG